MSQLSLKGILSTTDKVKPPRKPPVEVWQLVFLPTGERIIHGAYSLCRSRLNSMPVASQKDYKIKPFKN